MKKAIVGTVVPPENLRILTEEHCKQFFDNYDKYSETVTALKLVKIPLASLVSKKIVRVLTQVLDISMPTDDASEEVFVQNVKALFGPKDKLQAASRLQGIEFPKLFPNAMGKSLLVNVVGELLEERDLCGAQLPADKKFIVNLILEKLQKAAPQLHRLMKVSWTVDPLDTDPVKTFCRLLLQLFDDWSAASLKVRGGVDGASKVDDMASSPACATCLKVGRRADHSEATCWLKHPELKPGLPMRQKLGGDGRLMAVEAVSNNDSIDPKYVSEKAKQVHARYVSPPGARVF
jgi:hypothetical protein